MKKKMAYSGLVLVLLIVIIWWFYHNDLTFYHYIFMGESQTWSAQLDSVGNIIKSEKNGRLTYDCNNENTLVITCKKDIREMAGVKHLEIHRELGSSGGSLVENLAEGSLLQRSYTFRSGGSMVEPDDIVRVTISVDGEQEIIELQYQN